MCATSSSARCWTSRRSTRGTAESCATASIRSWTICAASAARGKQRIAEMEEAERARTGINSLKIRFNRVFGYYIEVSKSNLASVPADYHRKQTIAGGERFITPELKEYEEKVLGADERIVEREVEIFEALRQRVAAEAPRIQDTARGTRDARCARRAGGDGGGAELHEAADARRRRARRDRRASRGRRAARRGRVRPERRHARRRGPPARRSSPGPNMGGKSTYLRQTALLCLMAQAGSFVPARAAKLPVVDRLFARVGASDNIARGQSTFMVEMQETANILHSATSRSLVILDEIGRGTATFDGLSLAWAVAEHLASNPRARPKTIFATHYHELTDLADALPGVVNFHVVVREWKEDIVFLRKVVPGRSGSQLRHPRGAAGRAAAIGCRACAGDSERSRARRAVAWRSPVDERARRRRPRVRSGCSRRRLRSTRSIGGFARLDINEITPMQALALLAELKSEVSE